MLDRDDTLTVKWGIWIGVLVMLFGSLFIGWQTNNSRITRLETSFDYTVKSITELKESQSKVETLVTEIRFDQQRRSIKEK